MQFDEGEVAGAIDDHEHEELALFGSHLGDVDVEGVDGIRLELSALGLVTFDFGQERDVMALEAAAKR